MTPTDQAEIEALGWIVAGALVVVIAAVWLLIRSGRSVSLPGIRWRSRRPRRVPGAPRGRETS